MSLLLVSPRLIDAVLLLTVAEAVGVILWRRRRGLSLRVALLFLPGICLMLALRAALAGAAWPFVPAALALALPAHLIDLRSRLKT